MTTFLCFLAWIFALITVPLVILDWATISRTERIRRLRKHGWSQQRIADHLGISRYRVRQALA